MYFYHKCTQKECASSSGVAKFNEPMELLKYDQDCLVKEMFEWWNLQDGNPFDPNIIGGNVYTEELCKGLVLSWYIRARKYHPGY